MESKFKSPEDVRAEKMNVLFDKVVAWGEEKGILSGSTPFKQMTKTVEEFAELSKALAAGDQPGIIDGIGDVVVTLILLTKLCNIEPSKVVSSLVDFGSVDLSSIEDGESGMIINHKLFESLAKLYVVSLPDTEGYLKKYEGSGFQELIDGGTTNMVAEAILLCDALARFHGGVDSVEDCLEVAYNEISGRTGKMIDGLFVKDA